MGMAGSAGAGGGGGNVSATTDGRNVRYIEWIALNKFHFRSAENRLGDNISILDAYPEYDQSWAYWNDHFVTESRKRPNGTKNKLYLKSSSLKMFILWVFLREPPGS